MMVLNLKITYKDEKGNVREFITMASSIKEAEANLYNEVPNKNLVILNVEQIY